MKFQDWLKRQGEYVSVVKLKRFVKDKEGEIYDTIREEILSSDTDIKWIPTAVYDNKYYRED